MKTNNMLNKVMSMYIPEKLNDVRYDMNGNVAVKAGDQYISIDANGNLTAYPTEMTFKLPAFSVAVPLSQVKPGDIVCGKKSYFKVTKVDGEKLIGTSYYGTRRVDYFINDFLMQAITGQKTVRIVYSFLNGQALGVNPMFLMMALGEKDSSFNLKEYLPLMMLSGNGTNLFGGQPTAPAMGGMFGGNPMNAIMLMGMMDGEGDDDMMKIMMMSSLMSGNGMFSTPAAAPADN